MGAMSRTALVILNGLDKDDPLWWPGFCADIADGGSIPKMLEANSITWGVFSEWLNDSQFPDRKERYDTAIAARLVYHKEKAVASVARIAGHEHAEAAISVADTLKAASMVLGDGVKPGISVQVGAGGMTVRLLASDASL